MNIRTAALLGTSTSNNGHVATASSGLKNIRDVAAIGDLAHCPDCNGDFPILALLFVGKTMPNGQQIALEGDPINCRCPVKPVLLASTSTLIVPDQG